MHPGGIETLILRMSDWLIKNGHTVDLVLYNKKGDLLSKININVKINILGRFPEWSFIKKYLANEFSTDYDVIYSFIPPTSWMALLIAKKCINNPIILHGVYHIYDFKIFADGFHRRVFNEKIPDNCKAFMSQRVKEEHEKILGRSIINPIIWPLPIITSKFEKIVRHPKKFKIVSIGRLETFKTYNILMLDLIKCLINEYPNVNYYIYGSGVMFKRIKSKIEKMGLKNNVFLMGTIDYDKIPEALSDAYAFIGMGTSVIEAGLCKVPSITAIAYSKELISHGFIHELEGYNCGEYDKSLPVYNIKDLLLNLFNMEEYKYNDLCSASYYSLREKYSIEDLMNKLMIIIERKKREGFILPNLKPPIFYVLYRTIRRVLKRIIKLY